MYVYTCSLVIQDKFFLADKNGHFTAELAPLEVKGKKGKEIFDRDEHPRETTVEKLGKLPPVFKENGTVSAGNASVSHSDDILSVFMPWCSCTSEVQC